MRIIPIAAYADRNTLSKGKSVSFGQFENTKAQADATRILTEPRREGVMDSASEREKKRQLVSFLDLTPYVKVKHNYGMTYIVANRNSYIGHQNECRFDELFDEQTRKNRKFQADFNNGSRTPAIRADRPALEKQLPYIEPDYLMTMYDNKTSRELGGKKSAAAKVSNLERDLTEAETNYQRDYNPGRPASSRGNIVRVSEMYGIR